MAILFSGTIYYFLEESLLQDFDDALFNYSVDVAQTIEIGPKEDLLFPPLKVDEGKIFPFPSGTSLMAVRHISGKELFHSGDFGKLEFPYKKSIEKILSGRDSAYVTITNADLIPEAESSNYRLITFPLDSVKSPKLFLQIAVPMSTFESQLERMQRIIWIGLPAVIFVALIAGLFLSSRALRPVQEIIQAITQIKATDLHQRVPLPSSKDEIRRLAETQNQMLERIEVAFASQERFIADASHQLLTPLTILRGEIEVQQKVGIPDPKFLTSALQEVENLSRIVKDMLLLAHMESGQTTTSYKAVDLSDVLLEVMARVQKIAQPKNVILKFDILNQTEEPQVLGDHDLLSNLFFNLIENAVKYSPINSTVHVRLNQEGNFCIVEVDDQGPGIPPEHHNFIFERFSRIVTASKTKGFGLGLAIAKKIAQVHKADLFFKSKESSGIGLGTVFYFKIPILK